MQGDERATVRGKLRDLSGLGLAMAAALAIAVGATGTAPVRVTDAPPPVPTAATVATAIPQPEPPIRAAFYYPWFPEAWTQNGSFPYTKFKPTGGFYDSSDPAIVARHIGAMTYARLHAGIVSWWGIGSRSDRRVPLLLAQANGKRFKWALYYEQESIGDPTSADISRDLAYIRDAHATSPSYLRVNDDFVVFVYAGPEAEDGCEMAQRWNDADTSGAYVVLKVFRGYRQCGPQPDSWHQYAPALSVDSQAPFSFTISPGFNKSDEPRPRLRRDRERWRKAIRDMVASGAQFQLITSFNEWGEGTAVEPARRWATASGRGAYLDALRELLPPRRWPRGQTVAP